MASEPIKAHPVSADLYLRLSDLRPCDACRAASRECEHSSYESKERDLRRLGARLGWDVRRVVIENDARVPARGGNGSRRPASAFKRERVVKDGQPVTGPDGEPLYRVVRPGPPAGRTACAAVHS